MIDKKVALGITIIKELAKGKVWKIKQGYTIAMAEDFTIGFLLTKENGDQSVGGLCELSLKDIIRIADEDGVEEILPSDPMSTILRHAEELDW